MADEASGGSDHQPLNLTGEFAGAVAVDSDDDTSHTPVQWQTSDPDTLNVQLPVPSVYQPEMADRDRRSRVERACSNIPAAQSRNGNPQQRRHDDQAGSNGSVHEARNRHRDRASLNAGRHRLSTGSSVNQRPAGAAAAAAAAESELLEDEADDSRYISPDDVTVAVSSDLTLLPILHTDYVEDVQSSAYNWQVCC